MEIINLIIEQLGQHIDPLTVLIVLLGGLAAKKYWKRDERSKRKIDTAVKTLIVGTILITIYIAILHASGMLHKENYVKYFISYCFATTMYELLVKKFINLIKGG